MKKYFLFFAIILLTAKIQAEDLHARLESSYKAFVDALHSKDGEKLKNSMSTHGYIIMKNQMISSLSKFPDEAFIKAPSMTVNLKKEHFLKANEKGLTANAIYYGKTAAGEEAFIILKFLKENDNWKFDGSYEKNSDEWKDKLQKKDMSFLNAKDFTPDGVIPSTPTEITKVEYKAVLDIAVEGYTVSVKINGVPQGGYADVSTSTLVIGGVKKGINLIELRFTPIHGEDQKGVNLSIKAQVKNQEKAVFKLEDKRPSIIITKEFEIK